MFKLFGLTQLPGHLGLEVMAPGGRVYVATNRHATAVSPKVLSTSAAEAGFATQDLGGCEAFGPCARGSWTLKTQNRTKARASYCQRFRSRRPLPSFLVLSGALLFIHCEIRCGLSPALAAVHMRPPSPPGLRIEELRVDV